MKSTIAWGNIEIIEFIEQSKIHPNEECIEIAIYFHRIEMFDWVIDQLITLVRAGKLKKRFHPSKTLEMNCHEAWAVTGAIFSYSLHWWNVTSTTPVFSKSLLQSLRDAEESIVIKLWQPENDWISRFIFVSYKFSMPHCLVLQ